jgi:hypothetical protein
LFFLIVEGKRGTHTHSIMSLEIKMTKQGVRDLNHLVPTKKPPAPAGAEGVPDGDLTPVLPQVVTQAVTPEGVSPPIGT